MATLKNIYKVTQPQFDALINGETVGEHSYDEDAIYLVEDDGEVNASNGVDKITYLDVTAGSRNIDVAEHGIYMDMEGVEIETLNNETYKYAYPSLYTILPIAAGDNVEFEHDEEINVVKIKSSPGIDKLDAMFFDNVEPIIEGVYDYGITVNYPSVEIETSAGEYYYPFASFCLPIIAGDNVEFEHDTENQVVKISTTVKQGPQGPAGDNGTSVTITNITESTAAGGTSTVTFSDGKTLSIKNGSNGGTGPAGSDATVTKSAVESVLTGTITSHTHSYPVTSVAGKTGAVALSASDIAQAGYLATHPELGTTTTIPFLNNDLAFLTLKGGSVNAYTTTSTDLTAETLEQGELNLSGPARLFDGSSVCAYLMTDGNYVAVIDLVLHKMFQYNSNFYIDFGTPAFRAKKVAVYVMNKDTETAYTLKNSITNNSASYVLWTLAHTSKDSANKTVYGFNRLRIVLSDFNQSGSSYGRRLAEVGLVNYSSAGASEGLISRGGCTGIYGDLIPHVNNSINLGSSSKKWNNIYGTTIYQNGKQVANKEDVPTVSVVTGSIAASSDLNTVIKSGMYRLNGLPSNCPDGAIYGQLLVVHGGGDTISQIAFSYNNSNMWVRNGNPTDVGGTGSWKEWAQCYTTKYKPTASDIGVEQGPEGPQGPAGVSIISATITAV